MAVSKKKEISKTIFEDVIGSRTPSIQGLETGKKIAKTSMTFENLEDLEKPDPLEISKPKQLNLRALARIEHKMEDAIKKGNGFLFSALFQARKKMLFGKEINTMEKVDAIPTSTVSEKEALRSIIVPDKNEKEFLEQIELLGVVSKPLGNASSIWAIRKGIELAHETEQENLLPAMHKLLRRKMTPV